MTFGSWGNTNLTDGLSFSCLGNREDIEPHPACQTWPGRLFAEPPRDSSGRTGVEAQHRRAASKNCISRLFSVLGYSAVHRRGRSGYSYRNRCIYPARGQRCHLLTFIVRLYRTDVQTGWVFAMVTGKRVKSAFVIRVNFFTYRIDLSPDNGLRLMVLVLAGHGTGETADTSFCIDKKTILFLHGFLLKLWPHRRTGHGWQHRVDRFYRHPYRTRCHQPHSARCRDCF